MKGYTTEDVKNLASQVSSLMLAETQNDTLLKAFQHCCEKLIQQLLDGHNPSELAVSETDVEYACVCAHNETNIQFSKTTLLQLLGNPEKGYASPELYFGSRFYPKNEQGETYHSGYGVFHGHTQSHFRYIGYQHGIGNWYAPSTSLLNQLVSCVNDFTKQEPEPVSEFAALKLQEKHLKHKQQLLQTKRNNLRLQRVALEYEYDVLENEFQELLQKFSKLFQE